MVIFMGLAAISSLFSQPISAEGNKCGVNVGPYYGRVNQVRALAKAGGWIVALGTLGDCAGYGSLFGNNLDVVIRAYNAGQPFNEAQAIAWTATLGQLDSKGQMIYFMPWNEPNQGGDEGGSTTDGTAVVAYMNALRKHLGDAGLLGTKVTLLSPMLNKTHDDFTKFLDSVGGGDAFYKLASGSSINEYDNKGEGDSTYIDACRNSRLFNNNCKYDHDQVDIPSPYYALESGVTGIYANPRYEDGHISKMLSGSWSQRWADDSNFKMFAVFSYDPIPLKGEPIPTWDIFNAPQTKSFYNNSCTPGAVTPIGSFDQTRFNTWLESQQPNLVECGECGFAPKDAPGFCSGVGRDNPAYDLSIYDEYDADPDSFYVHPIKGLEAPYASRSVTTIRNDMINQGYEAHCATPQFKIKLNQEGEEWMETLLADRNEGTGGLDVRKAGVVFGGDILYQLQGPAEGEKERGHEDLPYRSVLTVDYRNTLLPVFRDVTGKRWLTTSLEEYFGFSDTKIGDRSLAEINSAPINSLLSRTNYCIQALTILTKQEEMCLKIQDGDTNCALYPRPIPDSIRHTGEQYTVKTLLEDYKIQYGLNGSRFEVGTADYNQLAGISKFCQGMISSGNVLSTFETAVKNTPLNIDRAYRLGFLVTEIEMIYPSVNNMFSLFEHPNAGFLFGVKNPQDAVLVNAFKIPDFGTNKGGAERLTEPLADSTAGNVFWPDAAWLTRNSLMTQPEQIESEQVASDKRNTLLTTALQYDVDRPAAAVESDEIFCNVGVGTTGVGAPECQDPLSRATIDIVNASAQLSQAASTNSPSALALQELGFDQFQAECPTLGKELSTQISDPATLQPVTDPSKVYTTQFGADLLDKLFKDSTHEIDKKGSEKDPSFAETWRDREPFGTLARKYGDEDDPVDEIEDHWGGLTDWGLKSVFHVVNETLATKFPNDCCKDMRKVKHYLVYPVGYDLQTVQTVLAGSFFTTDELISLAEAAEEYDRIQVSGDLVNFEGAKKDVTFEDNSVLSDRRVFDVPANWPIEDGNATLCNDEGKPQIPGCVPADLTVVKGACQKIEIEERQNPGQTPPIMITRVGWKLPCTRNFGWEVVTDGETLSAGILGGKLGFYLREIQKTLNTKASDARQYLDTCKTTEQFLRGQCGSGEGLVPTPTPDTCTWMGCSWIPPAPPVPPIGPVQPSPGCADHPCFTMCATRNATGTVTVDFSWKFSSGCYCNDLSDHELLVGGVSQGRPTCINVISSSVSNRSCSYDNQPENVSICRKKGNFNANPINQEACNTQNDMEICVSPIQE